VKGEPVLVDAAPSTGHI